MKVCDRCKRELDTNKPTTLAGINFELCLDCANHIADHIRNYSPKKISIGDKISRAITGK